MKLPAPYLIAGAAVLAALLINRAGAGLVAGVKDGAGAVVDMADGLLTGDNAITTGARTDAYQGAGIIGTLGAGTDRVLGGVPSRIGETLGGWIYDITH